MVLKAKDLKKTRISFSGIPANIAMMSVFLILGLAVGIIFAKNGDSSVVNDFIGRDLVEITRNGAAEYSFIRTFFNLTKYTLILIFLAFCAIGVCFIPFVVFVKGFMISISVSSLMIAFGKPGILFALAMFGIQTLVQLPILLLVSAFALEISKAASSMILPKKFKLMPKNAKIGTFLLFSFVCILILLLVSVLDFLITPKLVLAVSKTLLS